MPASKADTRALIALNQAFKDHIKDEERRFDEIAKVLNVINGFATVLARVEEQIRHNGDTMGELVTRVGTQNGRVGKLENKNSWMSAANWALGVAVGALFTIIMAHLFK